MNISEKKVTERRMNTVDEICTDNCFFNSPVMLGGAMNDL